MKSIFAIDGLLSSWSREFSSCESGKHMSVLLDLLIESYLYLLISFLYYGVSIWTGVLCSLRFILSALVLSRFVSFITSFFFFSGVILGLGFIRPYISFYGNNCANCMSLRVACNILVMLTSSLVGLLTSLIVLNKLLLSRGSNNCVVINCLLNLVTASCLNLTSVTFYWFNNG